MEHESTPNEGAVFTRDTLSKMKKHEITGMIRMLYGVSINPEQYSKADLIDQGMKLARQYKGNADMRVVKKNDKNVEVPEGFVKIRVSPGEYNKKARPIILGLNFDLCSVPVNRDVVMHGRWLPCLEDAVERRYALGEDDDGNETLVWSDQHKYPFSIIVDNR